MKTMNRMDWLGVGSIAALAVAGAVACSSSSSPPSGTGDDGGGSSSGVSTSSSGGGSSSSSSGVTSSSSSSGGSSGSSSGDTGAPPADSGSDAGPSEGGATATLTVLNFLSWCSVTINGGTASTAASVTASVPVGSTATIVATPKNASFIIGTDPWFGVTQGDGGAAAGTDTGEGSTEMSTATVVVGANHCVSVCCGDAPPSAPNCPATNPCP